MVLTDLGDLIKFHRNQKNWSQAELGENSKVEPAQIGRFERGQAEPKLRTLQNIADALNVECSELLDDIPKSWRKARIMAKCEAFLANLERMTGDTSYLTKNFLDVMRYIEQNF